MHKNCNEGFCGISKPPNFIKKWVVIVVDPYDRLKIFFI